jgi:hypothetical protein
LNATDFEPLARFSQTQRVRYPLRNKNKLINVATEKEKREYIHLSAFASKPEAAFDLAVGCFCGVVRFFFAAAAFALANNAFTFRLRLIGGLGGSDEPFCFSDIVEFHLKHDCETAAVHHGTIGRRQNNTGQ